METVAPHAGAWIETDLPYCAINCSRSHPTRVRGLKPERLKKNYEEAQSHPTRVRGLKQLIESRPSGQQEVAPHAGAWIETR